MADFNDPYDLLRRTIVCHFCGKTNRCYVDDDSFQIKCGACRNNLNAAGSTISDTMMLGLKYDPAGYPLPPHPPQRSNKLKEIGAEISHLLVDGNFRSEQERTREHRVYQAAVAVHKTLCGMWAKQLREREELKQREERERKELREQQAREREELRQREEHERMRRQEAEQARQRAWNLEQEKRRAEAEQRRREAMERDGRANLLRMLKKPEFLKYLTGRQFEQLLGQIFKAVGCECDVTKCSGDQGVDVIVCTRTQKRIAIQAKNWSQRVGITAVQEIYAGKDLYACGFGAVIATSGFTKSARQTAKTLNVHLWGVEELRKLLTDCDLDFDV